MPLCGDIRSSYEYVFVFLYRMYLMPSALVSRAFTHGFSLRDLRNDDLLALKNTSSLRNMTSAATKSLCDCGASETCDNGFDRIGLGKCSVISPSIDFVPSPPHHHFSFLSHA